MRYAVTYGTVNQNLIKVSVVCNDFKSFQQPIFVFQFLLKLKKFIEIKFFLHIVYFQVSGLIKC